jgi:DNA adenine methylase
MNAPLKAPFPYFGGKRRIADLIWQAFGDAPNYIETHCGSAAVLLARPTAPRIETINDIDCHVANFWRAMAADPDAVAASADWPVNEADLHARSTRLGNDAVFIERMHSDPDFHDPRIAGIWAWGMCTAIGGNWLRSDSGALPRVCGWISGNGLHAGQIPAVGHSGRGIHSPERQSLVVWFRRLQDRLRRVRVCCGDFERVLAGSVTGESNTAKNMGMSPCAVFLDAPYQEQGRAKVYECDGGDEFQRAWVWALAHGSSDHFRIAVCGYDDGRRTPSGWSVVAWKAQGGFGNRNKANTNRHRERIWLSPHCLRPWKERQTTLFTPPSDCEGTMALEIVEA